MGCDHRIASLQRIASRDALFRRDLGYIADSIAFEYQQLFTKNFQKVQEKLNPPVVDSMVSIVFF